MKIFNIEIYTPENHIGNDFYLNKFPEKRDLISKMTEAMSKDKRYAVNEEEDGCKLAFGAVEKVLKGFDKDKIGAVIYASNTPEYLMPTMATIVHNKFELSKDCLCTDINVNCAGMVMGLEFANGFFLTHKDCEYILLVGSEVMTRHSSSNYLSCYCSMGDMGCAVLLERSDAQMFSTFYANTKNITAMQFPFGGISRIHKDLHVDRRIIWDTSNATLGGTFGPAIKRVESLLQENNIPKDKIAKVLCNQQTKHTGDFIASELGLPDSVKTYVGDKYGYTGSTTAMVCLHEALQTSKINDGDYLLFITAGAAGVLVMVLLEYKA